MVLSKVRYRVLDVLADVATVVNDVCYSMAVKANRAQGWLARHRAART